MHLFGKSSKEVFFLFNLKLQQFDYINEAVEQVWQVHGDVILKTPQELISLIDPDDRDAVLNRYGIIVEEGVAQEIEVTLNMPDGSRKEVKINARPVKDEAGSITYVAGEAEDVTKQFQHTEYLREFSRRKNGALEIIAHDLRGPLSIVKSITSLIESEHQEKHYDEVSTYTRILSEACESCLSIITNVISDENMTSPTVHVNTMRFELVEKIRRLLHSYQVSKGVDYKFELVTAEEKIMVELDEVKFMQVLNNLLSNAIKFTEPGGKISIELKKEEDRLLLILSDNGIGIPKELQPHIFERHSIASRQGLRGEPTNGVGLSIVRELVEVQGGRIWVESEEAQGAAFFLNYPLPIE